MAEPRDVADDRTPICPYCGCTRHDSERLHDGNLMEAETLVDAMVNAFLRNPGDLRPEGTWPVNFPDDRPAEQIAHLRAKMEAALGVAIRNMPYLSTLRSPGLDRDGERMREAAAGVCERRIEQFEALGPAKKTECTRAALYELRAVAGQIRALAHEEKAGC